MAALIGCWPFAGFFSKDYLLSAAYAYHPFFYAVGVATAFLTAFYMTRLVIVAFCGNAHVHAAEHPHESPGWMTVPLILLAVLSVIGGWAVGDFGLEHFYQSWAATVPGTGVPQTYAFTEPGGLEWLFPLALVVFGVATAWQLYWNRSSDPLDIRILANKFYFDEFYDWIFVGGQQMFARALNWIDSWILDGLIIRGGAYLSVGVGELLRLFQTGSLQSYAFLFSIGGILLIYFTLFGH